MKKRIILVSFVISLSIIVLFSIGRTPSKSAFDMVEKQKMKDKQKIEEAKKKVDEIRKMIIAKNKKFRVDITEAIKHKIEEITGIKKPKRIEREARVQSKLSEELFNLFMDELKRQSKKKKKKKKKEKKAEKKEPKKKKAEKKKYFAMKADPNASKFNWRDRGKLTSIKHQGTCGSCWAFTALAAYEGCWKIQNGVSTDLSEQYLVDCAKDRHGRDAGSCSGGWYGMVFDYLTKYGNVTERKSPYKGKQRYCGSKPNTKYKVITWSYVKHNAGIPSVKQMKRALCKYGPIAACVKVTPAFQAYVGGIFDEHASTWGPKDINHGIVIVGWDDSKKSYLVKNSWGTRWGDKGYIWIEYGCNNIGYGAAWILVKKE